MNKQLVVDAQRAKAVNLIEKGHLGGLVLRRTVVVNWGFDNQCRNDLLSQVIVKSVENSKTLVSDLIGQ